MTDRTGGGVLAEVLANQAKLSSCQRHDFQPITPGLFGTKYRCTSCKGEADGLSVRWYELGRAHGGKGASES